MTSTSYNQVCRNCAVHFSVSHQDLHFYNQIDVPQPTFCPECRLQRRLAWRNERFLYRATCAATKKEVISVYAPDQGIIVYHNEYWFSDGWNALEYGREFDFSRPFFEQFNDLMRAVPQLARSASKNENCDYVNQAGNCKSCYLVFEAVGCEECLYSNNIYSSRSCMDVLQMESCELCYECVNCERCYNLQFSEDCQGCSDSQFLKNCIGCTNCFGSVGLRHQKFHLFNKQLSEAEYQNALKNISLSTYDELHKMYEYVRSISKGVPTKLLHGAYNENSNGDYLWHTRNCAHCFDLRSSEDCSFVTFCAHVKNAYDITVFGGQRGAELCYEGHCIGERAYRVFFSDQVWDNCSEVFYSKLCTGGCQNLFGCIGLRRVNNCVFNKAYTTQEYEILTTRLRAHMRETGEWGEFFPISISPYAYNETEAQFHFPLSREQAHAKGYHWREPDLREYQTQTFSVPDRISEVADSIIGAVLACKGCKKNFKIVTQELAFYRRAGLPIPPYCQECRHRTRMRSRNELRLWSRVCENCRELIQTSYSPQQCERVYCEQCYDERIS